eukprot:COSAG03_NODE_725_length_6077_cov_23.498829_3_plen_42_part_00
MPAIKRTAESQWVAAADTPSCSGDAEPNSERKRASAREGEG